MFSIGIDLGGTNTKLGLVSTEGKILRRLSIPTFAAQGPESVVTRIVKTINSIKAPKPVKSIGIGCAGLVNHSEGIIHFSPNLPGWQDVPLKKWVEKELESSDLKAKVMVGNDANAFTLGEYCFGVGKGSKMLLGVTLGTGVGAGIVANGKLLLGANQAAGEVGHTSINLFGPKCKCGNFGCLERYVGAEYIVRRAIKKLKSRTNQDKITPKSITQAAKKGDKLAIRAIKETAGYIGIGIANAISLLDPDMVVIGGGLSGFGKLLLNTIRQTVSERVMNFPQRNLKIVFSQLKDDAAILGTSQFDKFI